MTLEYFSDEIPPWEVTGMPGEHRLYISKVKNEAGVKSVGPNCQIKPVLNWFDGWKKSGGGEGGGL